MRYFARIAYKGTNFFGWQSQSSGIATLQQTIEKALTQISGDSISIIGCGRTDTGVHASDYYFHFNSEKAWEDREYQLNAVLPYDISIKRINAVDIGFHARYDAIKRTYEYHLHTYKDPFLQGLSYHYKESIDIMLMNQFSNILLNYSDFSTFCKSGTDVSNKNCQLYKAQWSEGIGDGRYIFRISSNRFLRGMVRLIVGMCLNAGKKKITMDALKYALENKLPLDQAWSVPPEGLYLSEIQYPYSDLLK